MANPLAIRPTGPNFNDRQRLLDYAAELNRKPFSYLNGWHWFVATRVDDGVEKAYLDRRDYADPPARPALPNATRKAA